MMDLLPIPYRTWVTTLMGKMGKLELSSDDNSNRQFVQVLDEWMYILESSKFNESLLTLDIPSTQDLPLVQSS